eukprot:PhF_6_TR31387/c0_g1_i3/m.45971
MNGLTLSVPLGIGTMMWGGLAMDRKVNGYIIDDDTLTSIITSAIKKGITFIDTAEGYGGGSSEERIRDVLAPTTTQSSSLILATKFLPTLWRWTEASFLRALRGSNRRLGITCCDVYFIHSPVHPLHLEVWVRAARTAIQLGLMKKLGLSNFNTMQVRRACSLAAELGVPVAANQLMVNLMVFASPELQATLLECKQWGLAIIAYSPLGQGLLCKPLMDETSAKDVRLSRMTGLQYDDLVPLRSAIMEVAAKHGPGTTMTHVCIAWSIAKGCIPLVGCRKVAQLEDAFLGTHLALTPEDVSKLDAMALGKHTFEKPRWRRSLFVFFISMLVAAYRVSNWMERNVFVYLKRWKTSKPLKSE